MANDIHDEIIIVYVEYLQKINIILMILQSIILLTVTVNKSLMFLSDLWNCYILGVYIHKYTKNLFYFKPVGSFRLK